MVSIQVAIGWKLAEFGVERGANARLGPLDDATNSVIIASDARRRLNFENRLRNGGVLCVQTVYCSSEATLSALKCTPCYLKENQCVFGKLRARYRFVCVRMKIAYFNVQNSKNQTNHPTEENVQNFVFQIRLKNAKNSRSYEWKRESFPPSAADKGGGPEE